MKKPYMYIFEEANRKETESFFRCEVKAEKMAPPQVFPPFAGL